MHHANGVVWEAVSGSSLTSIRRTDSSTALSCAASQSRPMFVDTTAARTDAFAAARSASSCRSRASGDVSSDTVFNAAAKKEPMEFHAGSCADDARRRRSGGLSLLSLRLRNPDRVRGGSLLVRSLRGVRSRGRRLRGGGDRGSLLVSRAILPRRGASRRSACVGEAIGQSNVLPVKR